mmetsp:Transcript_38491/g.115473  ORF Transcript_38491/g.115473 Transcript_38491/m.115473 type:complete len:216 (+) Transcript_38491:139-786(+)
MSTTPRRGALSEASILRRQRTAVGAYQKSLPCRMQSLARAQFSPSNALILKHAKRSNIAKGAPVSSSRKARGPFPSFSAFLLQINVLVAVRVRHSVKMDRLHRRDGPPIPSIPSPRLVRFLLEDFHGGGLDGLCSFRRVGFRSVDGFRWGEGGHRHLHPSSSSHGVQVGWNARSTRVASVRRSGDAVQVAPRARADGRRGRRRRRRLLRREGVEV